MILTEKSREIDKKLLYQMTKKYVIKRKILQF